MRADYNINFSFPGFFEYFFETFGDFKPCQPFHFNSESAEPALKHVRVLVGENRRRGKNRDLFFIQHCAEGGQHRNLRFSEADIPGQDPVHRVGFCHIFKNFPEHAFLVRSIFVGEIGNQLFFKLIKTFVRRTLQPPSFGQSF